MLGLGLGLGSELGSKCANGDSIRILTNNQTVQMKSKSIQNQVKIDEIYQKIMIKCHSNTNHHNSLHESRNRNVKTLTIKNQVSLEMNQNRVEIKSK